LRLTPTEQVNLIDMPSANLEACTNYLQGRQLWHLGDPYAVHVNRVVLFDPLREDPRFQSLLAKMNLWPEGD
jgi:hypothetical protein